MHAVLETTQELIYAVVLLETLPLHQPPPCKPNGWQIWIKQTANKI